MGLFNSFRDCDNRFESADAHAADRGMVNAGYSLSGFSMEGVAFSDAIGAFLVPNLVILIIGLLGWFRKIIDLIPMSTAAALNAGILMPFALQTITGAENEPVLVLVLTMIATFFIVRTVSARWSVAAVLVVGLGLCIGMDKFAWDGLAFSLTTPVLTMPTFTLDSAINIAKPLTVLALTGQYLPGLTVVRSFGYQPDSDIVIRFCGIASLLAAPFGSHNINPSSMTAGIVAGPEAGDDPSKRYVAAVVAGVVYLIFGTLAASFVMLFAALPSEAIMALAGLSLLGAIAHSIKTAIDNEQTDVVVPTVVFIVAISNFELFSIGSPFWAIVIGIVLSLINVRSKK
ncbi:MAG: benzoate/H(+) symporter BenE family transporter [Litoreibacter sp.]